MNKLELNNFLPYHLSVTSEMVSRALSKVYAGFGVTIPEWRVMVHLNHHGSLTPSELGIATSMDKARVSRALILMDKKALITREVDQRDKRVSHICLTETGKELFIRIEPEVLAWNARLADEMPSSQHDNLLQALKTVETWCKAQGYTPSENEED
ncbi:MAG: MarR family transcriptional regulator [Thiothrix sp.]|nr:MAG: MarR family transcriptional regulator [Thiothrix sp.]